MRFSKCHALGNDYFVMTAAPISDQLTASVIRRLCDRHYGHGTRSRHLPDRLDVLVDDLYQRYMWPPMPAWVAQLSIDASLGGRSVRKPAGEA
jgi:hypothetical protein